LKVRPGAYPTGKPLKGETLVLALALLANIRLDWEGFPGRNVIANKLEY
jgi:hypothetical protein